MKSVVTIGLGYIGLPTSALIASKGIPVYGVDINKDVVDTINKGEIHIVEPDLQQIVKESVENGTLKAGTKAIESDVYLIVVPTPFKENHEPDISYIEAATQGIISLLKEDDLYIIESTSPIGTTEKMRDLIFSKRPELEGKLNIAYCPERVLPGNVMHELVYNDRVIGGIDEKSTQKAVKFYSRFVKGELHSTNAKTAEMCKLVENSSRDVQIAFANELSIICDKAGVDVWELIDLANKHPRVNILRPGAGVGGHCIAVDPYFITSKFPIESKLIGTAREINNYKALWCVEKIEKAKLEFELKNGRKPKTALMGLAFKPNIDDLRESPAFFIVNELLNKSENNNHYLVVEPNLKSHSSHKLTNFQIAYDKADIVVFLVYHDCFSDLKTSSEKIILNFCKPATIY